jgi:hypothetical protein
VFRVWAGADALVHLEVEGVLGVADAHAEARVAVPELLERGGVLLGALLQGLEELERGKGNGHGALLAGIAGEAAPAQGTQETCHGAIR